MNELLSLLLAFGQLSLLAVGGATAVLPTMMQMTTVTHPWITGRQFTEMYSMGQLAPGPNMIMVMMIGYTVAGWPGAAVVLAAFFLPSSLLTLVVGRIWTHFAKSPWRNSVQQGLAPITIGLMAAGVVSLGASSLLTVTTWVLGVAVTLLMLFRHVNPAILILLCGVIGWLVISVLGFTR
jgi:chromate transporter